MDDPRNSFALRIVVDDREPRPGLAEALAALWQPTAAGRLPAGDVEIGRRVLVERKTVADFVASLEDGRLFEQAYALARACVRPLLVVEGEEPWDAARLPPDSLRGVLLALLVGFRIPMLRTSSTAETARLLAHLAAQEARRLARAGSATVEPPAARQAMDLLGAIPGVGDTRARQLIERFGSVRAVLAAEERALRETRGVGRAIARAIRRAGDAPEGEVRDARADYHAGTPCRRTA